MAKKKSTPSKKTGKKISKKTSRKKSKANAAFWLILGNQLFAVDHLRDAGTRTVFMAEDMGLCSYVKHHKQKIVLFLSAMRHYADELRVSGYQVNYLALDDQSLKVQQMSYEAKLNRFLKEHPGLSEVHLFEVEDRAFEQRLIDWAAANDIQITWHQSPMFLTSRETFQTYIDELKAKAVKQKKDPDLIRPFMAKFYEQQRKRMDLLMTNGKPEGGQWSFDAENRKKVPAAHPIPMTHVVDHERLSSDKHIAKVLKQVDKHFASHPGESSGFWWPVTRRESLNWLDQFMRERFQYFGPYEDALNTRDPVLFHSAISPMLNMGLLTPDEIISRAIRHASLRESGVSLASLEGFVRQIIGWREFVRGVDRHFGESQASLNHWGHHRKMKACWWDGTTGLYPLDLAIKKSLRLGWSHHIERLMVLSNLMNLCEIEPVQVYDWFMCMYVDSSDWVMGPNVYGMGLMSDGGIFATKPYICGSNYILKMSNYKKGDWCDVMDGLYWRFIERHRDFFIGNPRMSMMVRSLDKLNKQRRENIFAQAEMFIDKVTSA